MREVILSKSEIDNFWSIQGKIKHFIDFKISSLKHSSYNILKI